METELSYAGLDAGQIALAARDERIRRDCRNDLMQFTRYFWHVNDPATPMVEGWPLEAIADHLMSCADGHIKRLILNVPPGSMKSLMSSVFFPAWLWGPMEMPHLRFICASYTGSLTMRDNRRFRRVIQDSLYQRLWGHVFDLDQVGAKYVSNSKTGWKLATSVEGVGTGERGDHIIIDDANNPKDVESDTVRDNTNIWLREVMPDRLNSLEEGVIINIQQRTHEEDATGTLIKESPPGTWTWLCIPAEYDSSRHCITTLEWKTKPDPETHEGGVPLRLWQDPRGLDENGEILPGRAENGWVKPASPLAARDGTLFWPERISRAKLMEQKAIKGPFAFCTPAEAPILMADLSLRPIGTIQAGDEIVGFETGCAPRRTGETHAKRRLCRARVLSISISVQEVVKMRLSSGRTIRCTADHKWYTGRSPTDRTHKMYQVAGIGTWLPRVCDPELKLPTTEEDWRTAGWVAGFFDGEGSAVMQNRREGDGSTCLVTFTQGTGRNLPLCGKLERSLRSLGLDFGFTETKRSDAKHPSRHFQRMYWIRRAGLPQYQKFLHVVQPTKWRERIIEGALHSNFVRGWEQVLSIEPDGEETVYGLETTTGNYIVWGIASSNSGQYGQAPTVRGGNIILEEWWRYWPNADYPNFIVVFAGLDTAIKEGEMNDFNAFVVMGIFADESGMPNIMLRHAWRMRGDLPSLCLRVGSDCRKLGVDYLLIEDKTRGHDCDFEIKRQFGTKDWTTRLMPVDGDKVSRVMAVQHVFSGDAEDVQSTDGKRMTRWKGGIVWAPDREFAQEVIEEVKNFPRGKHDDYVDAVSMVVGFLRKTGVIYRPVEFKEAEDANRQFHKPVRPLYNV